MISLLSISPIPWYSISCINFGSDAFTNSIFPIPSYPSKSYVPFCLIASWFITMIVRSASFDSRLMISLKLSFSSLSKTITFRSDIANLHSWIMRIISFLSRSISDFGRMVPMNPTLPAAYLKRKKRNAPSIVEIAVKNTGAVPNLSYIPARLFVELPIHLKHHQNLKNKLKFALSYFD